MNRLSHETSPYLLQHAHNPVDWYPWGTEALNKATAENRPILLSIGYSACHWCHVMERECFEKEDIAAVMNEYFVCIKVDREERPDVDAVYMDAVHAMGVRGGWPLNVFLLPNAKPFYGVTYLPPQNWVQLLKSVNHAFTNNYNDLAGSAEGFVNNMLQSESEKYGLSKIGNDYSEDALDHMFDLLKKNFDGVKGGMDRAPKFPMPSIYKFLLRYFDLTQNPEAIIQIELSLNRIALGGIYDHVGGGWTRYSVDEDWFIPHFEKMLYDNAQLLSVYAEAFSLTKNELYANRLRQTIHWLQTEMLNDFGGFYSALDADSEGIEGKYYIWTYNELAEILGDDFAWFSKLYNIQRRGNWEHGYNHLHLTSTVENTAKTLDITEPDLLEKYVNVLEKLNQARSQRIRPGLDDKTLTSWNGLLIKGLSDAYQALGDENIRDLAVRCGQFIQKDMTVNGALFHSFKNGKSTITGFLEDYAAVIEGYIGLYQITFDESWILSAQELADYTLANFYDKNEGFFFFTDSEGESLIARKKEIFDNVIPSSNSIMAWNLYNLGMILDREDYLNISDSMTSKITKILLTDPQWATNWAALYSARVSPTAEIVISGPQSEAFRKDLERFFIPNKLVMSNITSSNLPLVKDKISTNNETKVFVCFNKTCQLPVSSIPEALKQLQNI